MKLHTEIRGDGARTAALVHGASESSTAWLRFADILVEQYDLRLILVDQRGHGRSGRSEDYSIEAFTADLVENLPTGLDLLIGQSLGALSSVLAVPELLPARYIGIDPPFAVGKQFLRAMTLMRIIQPLMPRSALRKSGIKRNGEESIDRQMANWDAWDRRMIKSLAREALATPFPPAAPVVPSTIVLAKDSVVLPEPQAEQFREFGWDVRLLPDSPHDMHIAMPKQLAALLDDLLAGRP